MKTTKMFYALIIIRIKDDMDNDHEYYFHEILLLIIDTKEDSECQIIVYRNLL